MGARRLTPLPCGYLRLRQKSLPATPAATSASVAGLPAVAAASAPLLGATAQ